jgi:hypothetical protein
MTVPGVGPIISSAVVAAMPKRFDQIVSLQFFLTDMGHARNELYRETEGNLE